MAYDWVVRTRRMCIVATPQIVLRAACALLYTSHLECVQRQDDSASSPARVLLPVDDAHHSEQRHCHGSLDKRRCLASTGKARSVCPDFQRQIIQPTTTLEGRLPLSALHHSAMDDSARRAGGDIREHGRVAHDIAPPPFPVATGRSR